MDNSLNRIKAWIHWVNLEENISEDRLLMKQDLEKLIAVVEAAQNMCTKCGEVFGRE